MHARDLVDLAGLVALNGPLLVCAPVRPAAITLHQYWASSKFRLESWTRALKLFATLSAEPSRRDFDRWIEVRATLDEIFASEILTRVWTAVLVACDRRARANQAEPIARNVLASHLEARHRALALLVHCPGLGVKQAATVNRLRRRAERWTDVLVAGMLHVCDAREFAVERERAEDFAGLLAQRRGAAGGAQAWRLIVASMPGAFQSGMSVIAANPDANARITASILGCFPPDVFDSTGLFQSPWMTRLVTGGSDTQGTIGAIFQPALPGRASEQSPHPRRRP
jgi:hypothetical protein